MREFTGKEYLMIDIANQAGLDKLTWDQRIEWVQDNENTLEEEAEYADNKPLYRKAVYAYRNMDKPSGHIMFLDATASGIQLMACLSGDKQTADLVNLIDPENRKDVYQLVADKMTSILGYAVPKSKAKKPLMTH